MSSGFSYEPSYCLKLWFYSTSVANFWGVKGPHFDALTQESLDSWDVKEIMNIAREADDYAITQIWTLPLLLYPRFGAIQPWEKGLNGELSLGGSMVGPVYARMWVDQALKKSMGHWKSYPYKQRGVQPPYPETVVGHLFESRAAEGYLPGY